jgi:hypothetical protein
LSASWGRSMSVSGEPSGRRDSFGKPVSVSYGGTSIKPKRNISNTRQPQSTNINTQPATKVCTIL